MARWLHCWRCQIQVPMLEDAEWERLRPVLEEEGRQMVQRIRDVPPGTSPEAAQQVVFQATLALYFEITGFRETNPMAIGHHVVSLHGPPCGQCGVPVRTPRARMCTACGAPVRCH